MMIKWTLGKADARSSGLRCIVSDNFKTMNICVNAKQEIKMRNLILLQVFSHAEELNNNKIRELIESSSEANGPQNKN